MAGIKVVGGGNNYIGNNVVEGYEDGIVIEDSPGTVAQGNIVRSKQLYGPAFEDVVAAVVRSGSAENKQALDTVVANRDEHAVGAAWIVLGKSFGGQIGRFSLAVLANVLSAPIYAATKTALAHHGILLP